MINYQFSFLIAVAAFVYSYILTRPNALLNGTYNRLYDFFKTDQRANAGKPIHWLFMLLIHCEKCIAGQAALWLFLYFYWGAVYEAGAIYAVLKLIFFVSVTILITALIKNIYTKTES